MDVVEVDLEYKKTDFHLQECITGRVVIHLAQVDIKKIELYLIKLENYFKSTLDIILCYNARFQVKNERRGLEECCFERRSAKER